MLNYCYYGEDIDAYLNAIIKHQLGGFAEAFLYLLAKPIKDPEDAKSYYIFKLPSVVGAVRFRLLFGVNLHAFISHHSTCDIKILFPYRLLHNFWVMASIKLFVKENECDVLVNLSNPYGGELSNVLNEIKETLDTYLKGIRKTITIAVVTQSHRFLEDDDIYSSAVIVVNNIENQLRGQQTQLSRYALGEKKLRTQQLEVATRLLTDSTTIETQLRDFTQRVSGITKGTIKSRSKVALDSTGVASLLETMKPSELRDGIIDALESREEDDDNYLESLRSVMLHEPFKKCVSASERKLLLQDLHVISQLQEIIFHEDGEFKVEVRFIRDLHQVINKVSTLSQSRLSRRMDSPKSAGKTDIKTPLLAAPSESNHPSSNHRKMEELNDDAEGSPIPPSHSPTPTETRESSDPAYCLVIRGVQPLDLLPPQSRLKPFVRWVSFLWDIVPAGLWGLIIRDLIEYKVHPKDNYGNVWWKIPLGISPNQNTYSSHLGSILVQGEYWPGFLTLIGLTLLAAGVNIFSHFKFSSLTQEQLLALLKDIKKDKINDLLNFVHPRTDLHQCLDSIEELCTEENIFRKKITTRSLNEIVAELEIIATDPSLIASRYFAIKSLARLAVILKDKRVVQALDIPNRVSSTSSLPSVVGDKMGLMRPLDEEREIHRRINKIFTQTSLLFQYPLWVKEVHTTSWAHLFLLITGGKFAANLFLIDLLFQALFKWQNYFDEKELCKKQDWYFQLWQQAGENLCTPCPWPPLEKARTTQGCLNSLFAKKIPAGDVTQQLQWLAPSNNTLSLDLSDINWKALTYEEWDGMLVQLERIQTTPLHTFKMKNAAANEKTPSEAHTKRLIQFLQKVKPVVIELSSQHLGSNNSVMLIDSLPSCCRELYFGDNAAGDLCMQAIVKDTLSGKLSLTVLHVPGNNITDSGVKDSVQIFQYQNNTLVELNLADNDFQGLGVRAIGGSFTPYNYLEVLDISGVFIDEPDDMEVLAQGIHQSRAMKRLIIQNSDLKDEMADSLQYCMDKLESLDCAYNQFSTAAITQLLKASQGCKLRELIVANNNLDELTSIALNAPLSLETLIVNDNRISQDEFVRAIEPLSHTNIIHFDFSNLGPFLPDTIHSFVMTLSKRQIPLRKIAFNKCQLTTEDAAYLFSLRDLEEIELADNDIDGSIGESMGLMLRGNKHIKRVVLSENEKLDDRLAVITKDLPSSSLEELTLNGCPKISDSGIVPIIATTIEATPHIELLGAPDEDVGIDEKRAVYHAESQTHLKVIDVRDTGVSSSTQRAASRIEPATKIAVKFDNQTAPFLFETVRPMAYSPRYFPQISDSVKPLPPQENKPITTSPMLLAIAFSSGIVGVVLLFILIFKLAEWIYQRYQPIQPKETGAALQRSLRV